MKTLKSIVKSPYQMMQTLTTPLLSSIYTYDNTYREVFDEVIEHLELSTRDHKELALEKLLGYPCEKEEDNVYINTFTGKLYHVLTEDEANDRVKDYIEETLWAFNSDFIQRHLKVNMTVDSIEHIQRLEHNANPILMELIEDFDYFVKDAIREDGRGHFLNSWDGSEEKVKIDDNVYLIYDY